MDRSKDAKFRTSVAGIDRLLLFSSPTEVYEIMADEVYTVEQLPVSWFRNENYPISDYYCSAPAFREAHPLIDHFDAGPESYLVPSAAEYQIHHQLPAKHPKTLDPEPKSSGSETVTQRSVFPWPGGKGRFIDEILSYLPSTRTYVEPFAGSATVFFNKEPSPAEVLNDINNDIVTFYRVAKEQPGKLLQYIEKVPYSREQYETWIDEWVAGDRPHDEIAHAGRFWVLRHMQQMGKVGVRAGFKSSPEYPASRTFYNAKEHLQANVERLDDVVLESNDAVDVIQLYDGERTLFYCDPPYLGKEDQYGVGRFNHRQFALAMQRIEGRFAISYETIPDAFDTNQLVVIEGFGKRRRQGGQQQATDEKLLLNYDPETYEKLDVDDPEPDTSLDNVDAGAKQQSLSDVVGR